MNKNKHLLFASSLGVLLLLVIAAVQENVFQQWRRLQRSGRTGEGAISVQLRQIVNPGLRTNDRCVSCHVAMAPGEQSVSGDKAFVPHKPVVHDPAEYGCTVCHGGQGSASEKDAAHGDVHFWPEPMIPARWSYAGCGTCHIPLRVPSREALDQARGAFERLDCLACHRVDGRGGTIRPGGGGMEGPDLSRSGLTGYDKDWYSKHLKKSQAASSGPWKSSFAPIDPPEQELLAAYLATRMAAPALVEAKAVFHSAGCMGCHKVSGAGGDEGPDLSREGEKDPGQLSFAEVPGKPTLAAWFGEHFRSPGGIVANSQMPPLAISDQDIDRLGFYMLSLRRRELPGAYVPRDRVRATRFGEREFSTDGASIFGAFCAGCHGLEGKGRHAPGMAAFPSIANPDFLELASDEFLLHTVRHGRPGRRMPAWGDKEGGLKPPELEAVIRHLRALGGVQAKPDSAAKTWVKADTAPGKRLFSSICAGCHGDKGQGGEGPALNNKVLLTAATDTYLVETVSRGRRNTAMLGFLKPSTIWPALSRAEIESIVAYIRSWEGKKS